MKKTYVFTQSCPKRVYARRTEWNGVMFTDLWEEQDWELHGGKIKADQVYTRDDIMEAAKTEKWPEILGYIEVRED